MFSSAFRGDQATRGRDRAGKRRVLLLIATANLNCPSDQGLVADKLDPFAVALFGEDYELVPCLVPFSGPSPGPTFLGYKRTERILLQGAISAAAQMMRQIASPRRKIPPQPRRFRSFLWQGVFERLRPDLVMGIGLQQELLAAGHEYGVPSIEVQHGLLGRNTIKKYWPNSSSGASQRPSLVLAWDDHYVNEMRAQGIDAVGAGLGLQFLQSSGLPQSAEEPISNETFTSGAQVFSAYRPHKLLVLGSWRPTGSDTLLPERTVELLRFAANSSTDIEIAFRLHPVVAASPSTARNVVTLLRHQFPEAEIHDPRYVSLINSLTGCAALLARPSATAFEAAMLRVRTCIWGNYAEGDIPDNLGEYIVSLDEDPEIALPQILEVFRLNPPPPYQPENLPLSIVRNRVKNLLLGPQRMS